MNEPLLNIESAPLVNRTSPFRQGPRERTDVAWAVLFVLALISICSSGFFFVSQANVTEFRAFMTAPEDSRCFSKLKLDGPFTGSTLNANSSIVDTSGLDLGDDTHDHEEKSFWERFPVWIITSALVSVPLGMLSLEMLRRFPQTITYFAIGLVLLIQVALIIVGLALSAVSFIIPAGISLVLLSLCLCLVGKKRIQMCAKLLEVAMMGISDNILIIWYNLALKLGYMALAAVLLYQVFFAFMSGHAAVNREIDPSYKHSIGQHSYCVKDLDEDDDYDSSFQYKAVNCCEWDVPSHAIVWIVFAFWLFSWLTFTLVELRSFFTAGSLAQWYYGVAPSGREACHYSLSVAMTSHFGTISLAGLILQIIVAIRRALRFASHYQQDNAAYLLLTLIARCIVNYLEEFTKFATIFSSIKASAFCSSTKQVYNMFVRHSMSTVTVWWLPEVILGVTTFFVSLAWGVIVYFISFKVYENHTYYLSSHADDSVLYAVGGFITALIVLYFFSMIVLVAIDTIYVCYTIDLDSNIICKPMVHEVYRGLPIRKGQTQATAQSDLSVTDGVPRQANQARVVGGLPANYQYPSSVQGGGTMARV